VVTLDPAEVVATALDGLIAGGRDPCRRGTRAVKAKLSEPPEIRYADFIL
jgi:hypothetical protein